MPDIYENHEVEYLPINDKKNMTDTTKRHVVSGVTTFIATFLTVLGAQISSGLVISWSWTVISGLIITAVRSALKAGLETSVGLTGDK